MMNFFGLSKHQRTVQYHDTKSVIHDQEALEKDKLYRLRKYAATNLGITSLRQTVLLPEGVNLDEWLASNAVAFFNHIDLLYLTIMDYCTVKDCPVMNAGPLYEFHWCDGHTFRKPTALPAREYVDLLLKWIQNQIFDQRIFPVDNNHTFPKDFKDTTIRTIFKRLFRVYAHIIHAHFQQVVALGQETHLNSSFKQFIFFVQEFELLEKKDMEPLASLIEQINEEEKLVGKQQTFVL